MSSLAESVAFHESSLVGRLAYLDSGASSARVRLYNGSQPAFNGTPTTLLAEITLTEPAGTISSGVLSLTALADGLVLADGTATWARIVNGNGDTCFDCDVTGTGGTGIIKLSSTALLAGGLVHITSAQLA